MGMEQTYKCTNRHVINHIINTFDSLNYIYTKPTIHLKQLGMSKPAPQWAYETPIKFTHKDHDEYSFTVAETRKENSDSYQSKLTVNYRPDLFDDEKDRIEKIISGIVKWTVGPIQNSF